MTMPGRKDDAGKARWDLIPIKPLADVVDVLTWGARKYAPDNWKQVPDAQDRYYGALLRHLAAWRQGELADEETGISHLAHAGCCLLFLAWFENEPIPLVVRKDSDQGPPAIRSEHLTELFKDGIDTVKPGSDDEESPPTKKSVKGTRPLKPGDKIKALSPYSGKPIVRVWNEFDAGAIAYPGIWKRAGWTHEDGTEIADT